MQCISRISLGGTGFKISNVVSKAGKGEFYTLK